MKIDSMMKLYTAGAIAKLRNESYQKGYKEGYRMAKSTARAALMASTIGRRGRVRAALLAVYDSMNRLM